MHAIIAYSDVKHRREVIELWKSVLGYDAPHNAPELSIDRKLAVQDGLFFVAQEDGHVVGTVLAGYDGHRGWLYSVAVHPKFRKQRLGAGLIGRAEQALIDRGCVKINLQIVGGNASVTAFYESLGYAVEPRVSMGKKISKNVPPAGL